MKKQIYIASLVLVVLVAVTAQAQSRSNQQLRFHVPFPFNAGNSVLPAGDYRVTIVNPSSDHSVLRITSSDGKSTMIRTVDVEGWAAAKAKLSFRHYGDRYFLAQVWMAGEATGFVAPTSKTEKALRQQLGISNKNFGTVAINGF
ncbi:MAG TPA: hypothetical protein VIX17_22500 [Pyrinomonadaceae bacterium]